MKIETSEIKQFVSKHLELRKKWIEEDKWINPHSPSETNGYNKAINEEIVFLTFLKDLLNQS